MSYYFNVFTSRLDYFQTAGSSAPTPSTPTGTIDGSNTVFGVTASPKSVIADGTTYFLNNGYTYSSPNITMTIAPSEYIRYYI